MNKAKTAPRPLLQPKLECLFREVRNDAVIELASSSSSSKYSDPDSLSAKDIFNTAETLFSGSKEGTHQSSAARVYDETIDTNVLSFCQGYVR